MLTRVELRRLRQQVCLGSLLYDDYDNDLGIDPYKCSAFFDSYLEYLGELMKEDGIKWGREYYLGKYDNMSNLWHYYTLYVEDPLPKEEEEQLLW